MIASSRRAFLRSLAGWGGLLVFGPEALASGRWRGRLELGMGLDALDFGRFEELAALIQETEPSRLQLALIERLRQGLRLEDLTAAAALANARTFGGQDYTGYHCFMALMPAQAMAQELGGPLRALPVLKVIHRTATRIQETGGRRDALQAVPEDAPGAERLEHGTLRAAYEAHDLAAAERAFHDASHDLGEGYLSDIESILRESLDVHRIVLAWRAWDVLQVTGQEYAETLLRQSVRFCVDAESRRVAQAGPVPELRSLLPALLEEHGLAGEVRNVRGRSATPAEVEELAQVVFASGRADAARAVATALGGGLDPLEVGRALSLAANRLLLHDPGRARADGEEKPVGSVHGASVGVHASDAARAWRNLASVSRPPDAAANLIAGAYHTAGQAGSVGAEPYPYAREKVTESDPGAVLEHLQRAVAARDQTLAGACAARYGALEAEPDAFFATLLAAAVESNGALHAEKYYRTVREDFQAALPPHRWLHAVALARVCASQSGYVSPGLAEARAAMG